jgi:SAM-dependent methyltransferase
MMDSYDEVEYKGYPFPQSHPDRMCVIGRLLGMDPAPAQRCRVLELGCGDGGNLIPMSLGLPESDFLGLDLAEQPVARGKAIVDELRLRNIRLERMDVRDAEAGLGEFDYIIAYGLYSWVPEDARRKILAIAGAHLAAQGIAYINYNAYPGAHLRVMFREMLQFETRGAETSRERIETGRRFLQELSDSPALTGEYGAFAKAEARRLLERDGASLFHDELGEAYHPLHFHEFIRDARQHGLEYLAEATLSDAHTASVPLPQADPVEREQHLDFLKGRTFHHTLLCRREVRLDHELRLEEVRRLYAACPATRSSSNGETEFRTSSSGLRTAHPEAVAVLNTLIDAWPRAVPVSELPADPKAVPAILLSAFAGGLVYLYAAPPLVAPAAGERPTASPLARIQARTSDRITTLLHTSVEIRDAVARRLLVLLDGTRDRAALLEELLPLAPAGATRESFAAALDQNIDALARLGLLAE